MTQQLTCRETQAREISWNDEGSIEFNSRERVKNSRSTFGDRATGNTRQHQRLTFFGQPVGQWIPVNSCLMGINFTVDHMTGKGQVKKPKGSAGTRIICNRLGHFFYTNMQSYCE